MNTNGFQNGIQERMRMLIDSLGISDAQFARSVEYSRANLSQVFKGKRNAPASLLTSISNGNTNHFIFFV